MAFQSGHLSDHQPLTKLTPSKRPFFWGVIPRLIGFLDRFGSRAPATAVIFAVVAFMILSAILSRGGSANQELEQYLPHYLSQKPLPQKIFDYQHVEIWGAYRPRPLSYLIDWADATFIIWCSHRGFAHLLSLSFYVFWAIESILLWNFFRTYLRLNALTSGLLICLLSTDPVMSLSGAYFRSAKPGAACFLLISFVVFAACFRSVKYESLRMKSFLWATMGAVLVFCSCLFDEIPAAFAIVAVLMLLLEHLLSRGSREGKASWYCLIPIGVAVVCFVYYSYAIHPRLVWHFSRQAVSMKYQTGTIAELFARPVVTLYGALADFADIFGFLTGAISAVLALILMAALASVWHERKALVRIGAGALLMVICLYGMIARHQSVGWIDFRRTVYALPLTIVFVIFLGFALATASRRGFLSVGQIHLVLLVLLASNIASLPAHRRIVESQSMRRVEFTRVLMEMLHSPFASSSRHLSAADLAQLQKEVRESQVYNLLRQ